MGLLLFPAGCWRRPDSNILPTALGDIGRETNAAALIEDGLREHWDDDMGGSGSRSLQTLLAIKLLPLVPIALA